jgi:hypothetical protein
VIKPKVRVLAAVIKPKLKATVVKVNAVSKTVYR